VTESVDDLESKRAGALVAELEATRKRLRGVFETASDLVGGDEITEVLARITDRAAGELRAARYLLAVRTPEGGTHSHYRGFSEQEASAYANSILEGPTDALPDSWVVASVRSSQRDYGCLLASYDEGHRAPAEERELLEVYARFAASALDNATALAEAQRRYRQSNALLGLSAIGVGIARALAGAGTSDEIALRLAEAVSVVVDCDHVGVYLWDPEHGKLIRTASAGAGVDRAEDAGGWSRAPTPGSSLENLLSDPRPEPMFIDADCGDLALRDLSAGIGAVASVVVPLSTPDRFLGLIAVSVMTAAERLESAPELMDRLIEVSAQASTALQSGRLVDEMVHHAFHDGLTGLANRVQFADELRKSVRHAREHDEQVTVFYVDLDSFKPVNDRYGHDVGDQLLRQVAQRFQQCTRSTDLVARLGGDEFAILIDPRTAATGIEEIAGRIQEAFVTPFVTGALELHVGASVGEATFPIDAADAEQLLRQADTAMFVAKRARHRVRQIEP
jgi:diguanylate cyclase (GGDEF)-like protein